MNKNKLFLPIAIAALIGALSYFDLWQYLNLEVIQSKRDDFAAYYAKNPLTTVAIYVFTYVLTTALSLPSAALLTVLSGAIFGLLKGTIIVSFASATGATLAFFGCRYLFRDTMERTFSAPLAKINHGMKKDGIFYLFALRMIPAVPFFVVNLAMGLTAIRARTFFIVSQLGMLAGTAVYVNVGTQLAKIESLQDILSFPILISFTVLGVLPLLAKKIIALVQRNCALGPFPKPKYFDRNLVVIGAGAAGLVTAYIAATVKAKVTLIERDKMGGDCLNTGCVPSKALIRSAKLLKQMANSAHYGIASTETKFNFAEVMARVKTVIRQIEPHDSIERYTGLGVDCIVGEAKVTSPYSVEVNGQTLRTRAIVIASGSAPSVPPIPGLEETGYVTSDTLWDLTELPARFVVLGGGPIGCELAQSFARLGSRVTQVEMLPRILSREDPEISEQLAAHFSREGINVLTGTQAVQCLHKEGEKTLLCKRDGERMEIPFDHLLVAVGRKARTEGFGLEALGIDLTEQKTLQTDEYLQTIMPTIFAAGDVVGPYQFTHIAAHQAWYAAVNALFGAVRKFRVDYSVIPFATFTDPEVARVGLNEIEAKAKNIDYEITTYGIDDLDRAIVDGQAHGFVKALTVPGKDKILGATIVGDHAGDLLSEFTLAMRHGLGLNKILGTVHIYPTMAEASRFAAGNWKRAHAPEKLLRWVGRYHDWRRGESLFSPRW